MIWVRGDWQDLFMAALRVTMILEKRKKHSEQQVLKENTTGTRAAEKKWNNKSAFSQF